MQNLSSSMTFFYKFVFLIVWSAFFAAAALSILLNPPHARHTGGWMIALIWVVGTALIWRTCGGFKRVALDGNTLVISNYLREIRVPAGEIVAVSQNRLFNLRPVTITFKQPTAFGGQISFMPPVSFRLFSEDDVVSRLRRLATAGHGHPL